MHPAAPPSRQQRAQAFDRTNAERAQFTRTMAPVQFGPANRAVLTNMAIVPGTYYYRRDVFYDEWGWETPAYVYGMYPRYGIWDATFLAFALNHVAEEQYAMMLYSHWYDPEIQQWVQENNRVAAKNADLHAQLDAMNARVAQLEQAGTARNASYVPPDAQDVALSPDAIEQLTKK